MRLIVTYKSGRVETYEAVSGWGGSPSVPYTLEFKHFPGGWPDEMTEDSRNQLEKRINISLFSIEDVVWDDEDVEWDNDT